MDPLARCSGCRIINDLLIGAYHYGRAREARGVPLDEDEFGLSAICSNEYLSTWELRTTPYGLSEFAQRPDGGSGGGHAEQLNLLCDDLRSDHHATFADALLRGDESMAMCGTSCEEIESASVLGKVMMGVERGGPAALLPLTPYIAVAATLLAIWLKYGVQIGCRWLRPRTTRAKAA